MILEQDFDEFLDFLEIKGYAKEWKKRTLKNYFLEWKLTKEVRRNDN